MSDSATAQPNLPFLPFTRPSIDDATIAGVTEVLRSGWITSGPQVQAFEKAGADVLYAPGITDMAMVRAICSSVSKPVNVLAVPGFTVAALAGAGAKRISLGSKLTAYAFGMLEKASREILQEGSFEFSRDAMAFASLQKMFSASA